MRIFGDTARPPVETLFDRAGRMQWRAWANVPRGLAWLVVFDLVCALAGCAGNVDVTGNDLLVDPGRYAAYKCDDLVKRWKIVTNREKELRNLVARADQSNAGVVVGSLAYRSEYDVVVGDERLLQRAAADQKCALPYQGQIGGPLQSGQPQGTGQGAAYQSDQGIR
jgi:hypothetical protein